MLTATAGKAYTKRYFNERWREDCGKLDAINEKAANGGEFVKTADLNFHDNRGTAATILANENCKPRCKPAVTVNRGLKYGLATIEEFGRSERI